MQTGGPAGKSDGSGLFRRSGRLSAADGKETDEKVTYSLKDNSQAENVILENGTITAKKGSGITTVTVHGTKNNSAYNCQLSVDNIEKTVQIA